MNDKLKKWGAWIAIIPALLTFWGSLVSVVYFADDIIEVVSRIDEVRELLDNNTKAKVDYLWNEKRKFQ